jgi:hypothetical protein
MTESEDDVNSENESSKGEDEGSNEYREPRKKLKLIKVADDEMVPGNAKCLNCKEEFDMSSNDRGDCRCHIGMHPTFGS